VPTPELVTVFTEILPLKSPPPRAGGSTRLCSRILAVKVRNRGPPGCRSAARHPTPEDESSAGVKHFLREVADVDPKSQAQIRSGVCGAKRPMEVDEWAGWVYGVHPWSCRSNVFERSVWPSRCAG
jgi:hypothetical protein